MSTVENQELQTRKVAIVQGWKDFSYRLFGPRLHTLPARIVIASPRRFHFLALRIENISVRFRNGKGD